VRKGEWEVRNVQNVADILVDPEGSLDRRNHWEKTSHSLLVGAILHVLYAEADKTLVGVAAFLSDPRRPIEMTLRAMMTTPHLGAAGPHPVIASAARAHPRRGHAAVERKPSQGAREDGLGDPRRSETIHCVRYSPL
jgi:type IV secretion system protein VirD4